MKFLFVITKWPGGVGRYVSETCKELEKLGHKTEVISRQEHFGSGFIGSFIPLRRKVSNQEYDVLVTNDWSTALPLTGMKNHFCIFHGHSPNFPSNKLQDLVYLINKKNLIVVGDSLKKKYPKARLIYEGVNLNEFRPKKRKLGKIIGFVQNTEDETYRFKTIKNAIEGTGYELKIASSIPHQKMPGFYQSIDVFISIPDSRSGFNLCWLEAMACNIPTIGNNNGIGGKLPIIKIKEPPSKEKIIGAVERAFEIKNPKYRKWLKENKFTWENCAKSIAEFCEKRVHG